MPNKLRLLTNYCTGIITSALVLISLTSPFVPLISLAQTSDKTTDKSDNSFNRGSLNNTLNKPKHQNFLDQIGQINSQVNQGIQGINSDLTQGINNLSQELMEAVDKTLDAFGLPDLIQAGKDIETTIEQSKSDVLQLSKQVQGINAKQLFNRSYTLNQVKSVLGVEGQAKSQQKQKLSQTATNIASDKAVMAQSDFITQDIMKKIAMQNGETVKVLNLLQNQLEEQKQLTAVGNVNLSDIAQNLSTEAKRIQQQNQGASNVLYQSTVFNSSFLVGNK